jgi:hypothetical protein
MLIVKVSSMKQNHRLEGCPVIIEWDEKYHLKPSNLKDDRVRQSRIEQALTPLSVVRIFLNGFSTRDSKLDGGTNPIVHSIQLE